MPPDFSVTYSFYKVWPASVVFSNENSDHVIKRSKNDEKTDFYFELN